ncbi:hypothetical protein EDB89DRAFT_986717 [Lactarius sanguifluus]|nr:hypothetical protein EDB89DRAFT_986717 [Lactarius sanguifluus]
MVHHYSNDMKMLALDVLAGCSVTQKSAISLGSVSGRSRGSAHCQHISPDGRHFSPTSDQQWSAARAHCYPSEGMSTIYWSWMSSHCHSSSTTPLTPLRSSPASLPLPHRAQAHASVFTTLHLLPPPRCTQAHGRHLYVTARCKVGSGSGPEIIYFRSFRSRSGVAQPTAISDSRENAFPLSLSLVCVYTHTLSLSLSPVPPASSPSSAITSRSHGPPPPVLALQEASQPLVARPRVPAPRVAFVLQHPRLVASPVPFKMSRLQLTQSQDAVRGRADHRARRQTRRRIVLSCVIVSRPL